MNQGDLKIRPARVEDATMITECVAAAYRYYIIRLGKPPGPMLDDYTEVIQQHRVLVLTDGATIIGVLVLIRQDRSLLVDNVAVHPDCQGRGLGRKLMAFAEAEARSLGFSAVTLYTNERMTENIDLYKKLGYTETARKTDQGYQRVYMQKSLLSDETS
jgi:GNAT superfamily N-acetyltransferase